MKNNPPEKVSINCFLAKIFQTHNFPKLGITNRLNKFSPKAINYNSLFSLTLFESRNSWITDLEKLFLFFVWISISNFHLILFFSFLFISSPLPVASYFPYCWARHLVFLHNGKLKPPSSLRAIENFLLKNLFYKGRKPKVFEQFSRIILSTG
jgi:hypothetical protein